jgi:hypothetical protein
MSSPAEARRRWFGALFLILAAGMLVWGQTVLSSYLRGLVFVAYWLVCLGLTGLAMLIALLDARATRERIRNQQHELLRRTIGEISSDDDDRGRRPRQARTGAEPPGDRRRNPD